MQGVRGTVGRKSEVSRLGMMPASEQSCWEKVPVGGSAQLMPVFALRPPATCPLPAGPPSPPTLAIPRPAGRRSGTRTLLQITLIRTSTLHPCISGQVGCLSGVGRGGWTAVVVWFGL